MAEIKGLRETIGVLAEVDKVLYRESVKDIKKDVMPLVNTARSSVPKQTPLSGWKQSQGAGVQRSGGSRFPAWEASAARKISTRVRRERVRGMGGRRILIRVVQGSAAGAVFDMAGRENRNNPIAISLAKKNYGGASRGMWPAAEKHLDDVRDSVQDSVNAMERIVNDRLRQRLRTGI